MGRWVWMNIELENCGGVYSGVNRQGCSGSQRFLAYETHETLKRGGVVPAPSSVEDGGKVQGAGFKVQGSGDKAEDLAECPGKPDGVPARVRVQETVFRWSERNIPG